jgi:hypothetical protein
MKFTFHCMKCLLEESANVAYEGIAIDVRDDGLYKFHCPQGHEQLMELQQERFQILFEIGVKAIGDTYYREAVSSFTAALERFYEFCIRVYVIKVLKLSGGSMSFDSFDQAWKQISKQSERQYGAYIFLHSALLGVAPQLQSEKVRGFRNRVIHEGIFSTKSDAIEYGDGVLTLIRDGIEILRTKFGDELEAASLWSRMTVRKKAPADANVGLMYSPTVITLIDEGGDGPSSKTLAQICS